MHTWWSNGTQRFIASLIRCKSRQKKKKKNEKQHTNFIDVKCAFFFFSRKYSIFDRPIINCLSMGLLYFFSVSSYHTKLLSCTMKKSRKNMWCKDMIFILLTMLCLYKIISIILCYFVDNKFHFHKF